MQRHSDCCAILTIKTSLRVLADGWIQTQLKRRNQIPKEEKTKPHQTPNKKTINFSAEFEN